MQEWNCILVDASDKVCRWSDHSVLPVHKVQPYLAQLRLAEYIHHQHLHYHLVHTIMSLQVDQAFSCIASRSSVVVDNLKWWGYVDSLVEHLLRNIWGGAGGKPDGSFWRRTTGSKIWLRENSQKIVNRYFVAGTQGRIIYQSLSKVLYSYRLLGMTILVNGENQSMFFSSQDIYTLFKLNMVLTWA